MKSLRELFDEIRSEAGQPPSGPATKSRHTLSVTGALEFHGYVCLQYLVTPLPAELAGVTALFEGEAGVAIDDHAGIYKDCSVAYRPMADRAGVVGVFKVAPSLRSGTSTLRVLFPPLALTSELGHVLCEGELAIDGDRIEPIWQHWA